jgi:hypothetical protein
MRKLWIRTEVGNWLKIPPWSGKCIFKMNPFWLIKTNSFLNYTPEFLCNGWHCLFLLNIDSHILLGMLKQTALEYDQQWSSTHWQCCKYRRQHLQQCICEHGGLQHYICWRQRCCMIQLTKKKKFPNLIKYALVK